MDDDDGCGRSDLSFCLVMLNEGCEMNNNEVSWIWVRTGFAFSEMRRSSLQSQMQRAEVPDVLCPFWRVRAIGKLPA